MHGLADYATQRMKNHRLQRRGFSEERLHVYSDAVILKLSFGQGLVGVVSSGNFISVSPPQRSRTMESVPRENTNKKQNILESASRASLSHSQLHLKRTNYGSNKERNWISLSLSSVQSRLCM
ncbi:hypothetical protein DPEC_G00044140 [Dallia pectoralis]|uniref:Uncharacterized protein n=1 Tax=Dallia pectoralis TaxID=75939 RepID=A0ACC2H9W6_DALPE|nr:hypothetical protein DPEC_G00044140 [Dallia pectoralis]